MVDVKKISSTSTELPIVGNEISPKMTLGDLLNLQPIFQAIGDTHAKRTKRLKPASAEPLPTSTGVIPPKSLLGDQLDLRHVVKGTGDRDQKREIKQLDELNSELNKLSEDKIASLKHLNEINTKRDLWSYRYQIATWAIASCSILGGIYLCIDSPDPENGKRLMLAGIISLANGIMEHRGEWGVLSDRLSQGNKSLKSLIDFTLPTAIHALTFFGSGLMIKSLPYGDYKWAVQMVNTFQLFMTMAWKGAEFYTERQKKLAELDQRKIESETQQLNIKSQRIINHLQESSSVSNQTTAILKKPFSKYLRTTREMARG